MSSTLSYSVNFLTKTKYLGSSNFKVFADDKINVVKRLKFVFRRVENIVRKGENAGQY